MSALRKGLYTLAGLGALGIGGFFTLGLVSQDGSAPGLVDGRLTPCPDSPNCVSSEEGTSAEKSVEPLPPGAWDEVPQAIEEMGGTVTTNTSDYIAAEFKSSFFGFVDDVEFRKGDDGVHVRSASRVGYSDGGVNGERVKALRRALSE
ncbi:DUF1499 domain-containing protein [Erythrobacter sp. NAP1]|uniref:DUF1499 domain-containing protein n=1 Tax=Erythrobacter sp. NAP1 TaxID=237727 RepID=UPI000325D766|nr:DUF1499 domain-containing protein [Erythrobacter sp. NAP1]